MALCAPERVSGGRLSPIGSYAYCINGKRRCLGRSSHHGSSRTPPEVMSVADSEDPGEDPRMKLGRFLRARREQLRPEDLGFPSAGRRRTPGLRREEVAAAAGLSVTWYTYLEQGRGNDVSPGVLDSITRVFQLSEDERRYIYLLMYGHAPSSAPLKADIPVYDLIRNIVTATNGYPYPVYAVDQACGLVGWNEATTDWYDDFGRMPAEDRNMMRWMFASKRARKVFTDWESVARDLVARWRIDVAQEPSNATIGKVVDQFKEEFPLFRQWWDEHIVLDHRIVSRRFRRPDNSNFELLVVPFVTVYDSAPKMGFHVPKT
jgi:transcriptional regulator with XRE-family HTH domain